MIYLLVVSLIWAFSFGLIKGALAGLDSNFVSAARMLVSLVVFIPFLRLRGISRRLALQLALVGMVQYGAMYIAYIYSFHFLKAYEVALFTIFTPLYVTVIHDLTRKKFSWFPLLTALIAVTGTWVIESTSPLPGGVLLGFGIVQISNLCFAAGQVLYKNIMSRQAGLQDVSVFGLLYLGAFSITLLAVAIFTKVSTLVVTGSQVWTLLYLGAVASGLGFFLWNLGARRVNIGALAIFNDLKIPLAVLVSLVVFQEKADLPRLLVGGLIVALALLLNEVGWTRLSHPGEKVSSPGSPAL